MAGGVAIFDYNNDGNLDIFFANGADIRTLRKSSPKYSNRLFENDGKGNFKDVTQKAGLAGVGFDNGVAVADYDNDGYKDLFVGGVHGNRLYHNNGDGNVHRCHGESRARQTGQRVRPSLVRGRCVAGCKQRRAARLVCGELPAWNIRTEPACA